MTDNAHEFADQVVIITGAAAGIGAASARRFVAGGAAVVAVDRDADALDDHCGRLAAAGARVLAVPGDLRAEETAETAVARAVDAFGRVDVVHNNAGVFPPEGRLHEADLRKWDLAVTVNLRATAAVCRAALPHLIAAGGGAIVNTSSAEGRAGDVGWSSYGAAKAGVESLTRSIATQYGRDNIRCNCAAPGLIRTRATELLPAASVTAFEAATLLGRLGEAEEIAEVVAFLASPRAAYVTGQVLAVDGGLLAHLPLPAERP